jgi:hypothetical protein
VMYLAISVFVTPAKAGVQEREERRRLPLGPRLRGDDEYA